MAISSYFTFLTGTDLFVSYRWAPNSKKYVLNLSEQFEKRGLDFYLDEKTLQKGESVPKSLELAIRRSKMFVLLVTDDLKDSTWVPRELAIARKTNRKIVPISVGGALDRLSYESPWDTLTDLNRIDETEVALLAGSPSEDVAEKIDQSYTFTRRKVKAIRILFGSGLAFFLISILAIISALFAINTKVNADRETASLRSEASRLNIDIAAARTEQTLAEVAARTANHQKKTAEGQRDQAITERATAQIEAKEARTNADKAHADQLTAERLSRRATADRLVAEARRHLLQSPQKSMLISLEALNATMSAGEPPLFSAQQIFLESLGARGGRIFRFDKDNWINSDDINVGTDSLLLLNAKNGCEVWKIGLFPQLIKRLAGGCYRSEVSPGGRWALSTGGQKLMVYDLSSNDAEIKPIESGSKELPRDVFNDPEARWLFTREAIVGPSFEGVLDKKPGPDLKTAWARGYKSSHDPERALTRIRDASLDLYIPSPDWRWIARRDSWPDGTVAEQDPAKVGLPSWNLYDTQSTSASKVALEFPGDTEFLKFSNGSRWLATGTTDRFIKVHDLYSNGKAAILANSKWDDRPELTFSPDEQWLIGKVAGRIYRIWRLGSSESTNLGQGGYGFGAKIIFSPNSSWFGIENSPSEIAFWKLDGQSWKQVDLIGQKAGIQEFKFSGDSNWLVARGSFGVKLRDLRIEGDRLYRTSSVDAAYYTLGAREVEADFSPDSAWLITANYDALRNYSEHTLWDLNQRDPDEKPIRLNGIESPHGAFSADGHWLVFVGQNISRIYNLRNFLPIRGKKFSARPGDNEKQEVSLDRRWKIVERLDGQLLLWDLHASPTDSDPFLLSGTFGPGPSGSSDIFSPDSRWLITHAERDKALLWNLQDPTRPAQAFEFKTRHRVAGFSPDGRFLVAPIDSSTIRVWSLQASIGGERYHDFKLSSSPALSFSFSPNAHWLLVRTEDDKAYLLDLVKNETTLPIVEHTWKLTDTEFSSDSTWLLTHERFVAESFRRQPAPSARNRVKLWDLGAAAPALTEFQSHYVDSTFDPTAHWILSVNKDEMFLTDLRDRRAFRTFSFPVSSFLKYQFSPNAHWLAVPDGEVFNLYDLSRPGPRRTRLPVPDDHVGDPLFSPDGRWLLSTFRDEGRLWDLTNLGGAPFDLPATSDPYSIARMSTGIIPDPVFNVNGHWLIYQYSLWDLRGKKPSLCNIGGPEAITDLLPYEFSNDGRWLVGERDSTTVFWDLHSRVLMPQLFITGLEHPRLSADSFLTAIARRFENPSLSLLLEFDDLAELAQGSAGLPLSDEERRDLLLPDNKMASIQPKPITNKPKRRRSMRE
jgi:WD40 repeat protein